MQTSRTPPRSGEQPIAAQSRQRGPGRRGRSARGGGWALVLVVLLAGCAGFEGGEQGTDSRPTADSTDPERRADSSAPPAAPERSRAPSAPPAPDRPCNGRPGVDIPAVEMPAVTSEPVVVPDQQLGGETVEGFTVPGVDIPAQRVPAQCAVEEPAPAGCLGRVVIPATEIPGVTIPAVTIPGVSAGRVSKPAVTQPAVNQPAVRGKQVVQKQVCAQKVEPGEYRPSVTRPAVTRPAVTRGSVCAEGDCIDYVSVDYVTVDYVTVDYVTLEGKQLPEIKSRCVNVIGDEETTAYNLCADVLFAFNRANIRPEAEDDLRQVARSIEQRSSGGPVRVEGHTDGKGDPAYNERLSLRRAQAVRRWLIDNGDIEADRLTTRGLGETRPVAPNEKPGGGDNPSGRRQNRRVVVGVTDG